MYCEGKGGKVGPARGSEPVLPTFRLCEPVLPTPTAIVYQLKLEGFAWLDIEKNCIQLILVEWTNCQYF